MPWEAKDDTTGENYLWAETSPAGPDSETAGAVDDSAQDMKGEQEPRLVVQATAGVSLQHGAQPAEARQSGSSTALPYSTLIGDQ